LLPAALAAVVDGGEVWIVDSANFNTAPVQITKSVSIVAIPGVVGSVVAGLGGGPAINIATPGVKVSLRNLVVVPISTGGGGPISPPSNGDGSGIFMTAGHSLTIQDTLIAKMRYFGVGVRGPIRVKILDSVMRDNGWTGADLRDGVTAEIANSKFTGNFVYGIFVYAGLSPITTTLAINDSSVSSNGRGITAVSDSPATTRLMAIRTTASSNLWGISCGGAGTSCTAGYSVASSNSGYGFVQENGSTFRSMPNNIVIDNTQGEVSGTLTPLPGS
jgi:hypothetical protein